MKKTLGIVLVVIGLSMIVYTGFNYMTKEMMFDLGPIEINAEKSHIVEWTSVAGIIIMASGVVVIELEKKARI